MGQVPHPLGQTRHESKGSAIASRSLEEAPSGEAVGRFSQQRLVLGLTTPKCVEADQLGTEIDLAAHEAMGPERIDVEGGDPAGSRRQPPSCDE